MTDQRKVGLRIEHRFNDSFIGTAPAEISAHALTDAFWIVARLALSDHPDRAHDLTRRAEPALQAVASHKSSLDWMESDIVTNAFNGANVGALKAQCQTQARIDAPTVDQDRACAALAAVAALLGSCQMKALSQKIEKRNPGIVELDISVLIIQGETEGKGHWIGPTELSL